MLVVNAILVVRFCQTLVLFHISWVIFVQNGAHLVYLYQWCRRRGYSGCKRTPKSFDLLKTWAKSLKIWAKSLKSEQNPQISSQNPWTSGQKWCPPFFDFKYDVQHLHKNKWRPFVEGHTHRRMWRHFTGGRKKFALKITICPKNRQFTLKLTFWFHPNGVWNLM